MVKTIKLNQSGTYNYQLSKPGEEIEIIGRFKLVSTDILDIQVNVVHLAQNTKANISLKATVDDSARANVRGNIIVEETATGTESFLEQRILLLSNKAKAEAVPNLEIKTNDVKCSHAATVGKIDEEQIFYLNSRGISKKQAILQIAKGFLL